MADTAEQRREPVANAASMPENRLKLIRIKRKRGAEAPEDLVVEGIEAPGKRANTTLSSAMEGLGLAQQDATRGAGAGAGGGTGGDGGAAAPADANQEEAAATPAARRQRYRKLSTLSAAQLTSMDQQQLHSLLAAAPQERHQRQQQQQQRAGIKSTQPVLPAAATADRAAGHLQAGQAARYEHIRRRRGFSNFAITEQSADPLQQLASVYDLVRHEGGDSQEQQQAAAAAVAGTARRQQQQQPASAGGDGGGGSGGGGARRPTKQQRAAQQYDEGTLMCNYLPMIREYLQSQGRDMPMPAATTAGAEQGQRQGPAAVGEGQGQGSDGAQSAQQEAAAAAAAPAAGDESDSDYVYDLYAAVPEDGGDGEDSEGREQEQGQWWELHAGGRAPVVQIVDDDNWLVIEQGDVEDSDADTEDSNAEGFYAHDYPDEASQLDSSEDDAGHDPEGTTFHGGGGQQQKSWDEQSYGYGSGASDT